MPPPIAKRPASRLTVLRTLPAVILASLLLFGGGVYVGKYGLPAGATEARVDQALDSKNFREAREVIQRDYVGEVKPEDLATGATKGLVAGLGDPYSDFLTKEEAEQLNQSLAGTVEGIGIEIGERDGQVAVIAPLPDSPAAKAGIVAGDLITGVEGKAVTGQSLDEVAKQIRGPKGSQVTVEVQAPGQPEPRSLKITRDTVKSPSVTVSYRDNIAVIDLSRYGDTTKEELDVVVADIQAKKPRGIVLDLRSNPGGFLEGAVTVTSVFQQGGDVVQQEFAKGRRETKKAVADGRLSSYPLAILINKGSASASEITAGALRDNRGTALVGEKSFGKGSVQELEKLSDGAVLKLTIAKFFTPKGTEIAGKGLEPDVAVPGEDPEAQLSAALGQLR